MLFACVAPPFYWHIFICVILRWRGDYGGKVGKWFPATFCEEINVANGLKQTPDVPENASESEVSFFAYLIENRGFFVEYL